MSIFRALLILHNFFWDQSFHSSCLSVSLAVFVPVLPSLWNMSLGKYPEKFSTEIPALICGSLSLSRHLPYTHPLLMFNNKHCWFNKFKEVHYQTNCIFFTLRRMRYSAWKYKYLGKRTLKKSAQQILSILSCLRNSLTLYTIQLLPKISPRAYIFQRPLLRGLCTEGNLSFKIDSASL